MADFMNPSADLQAGIAAGWAEGQRQIEDMQDEIEHLEKELDESRAHAQRLEATLILTEDQRDKALKERDEARADRATWKRECSDLAIKMKDLESEHRCDQIVSNVYRAQASQFAAQLREAKNSQDILLNGIVEAVAQRDAAIAERDEARTTCKNQAETWLNALAESTAKLKTVIAERDALRKQLDDLKHDYTDKSYWGKE